MADWEKVISELQAEIYSAAYHGNSFKDCVPVSLLQNALSLLKAQEPVAPEEYTVVVSQYGNAEHKCYRCGACKCGLIRNANWQQKYCPECGREVKWQ